MGNVDEEDDFNGDCTASNPLGCGTILDAQIAATIAMNKSIANSPLVHVTPDDAPALVIMGGKDELVPAKHGHWIDKAFARAKVKHKLIVFPDAGHGLEGTENRATLVREAVAWFDEHLSKSE